MALISIPNSEDAQFYSDSIESLNHDNQDIQLLMKQQIHTISYAIKNYNESAQSLKINVERLNQNFKKFDEFSRLTTNRLNEVCD